MNDQERSKNHAGEGMLRDDKQETRRQELRRVPKGKVIMGGGVTVKVYPTGKCAAKRVSLPFSALPPFQHAMFTVHLWRHYLTA